jgi:serine/threonine protein kinase
MTLCINPRCAHPENSDNDQFCQSCQSSLLLKQRYRTTKVLGAGGFGKTYDVSDLGTRNKVLKVLFNDSPKAIELFQREAEFLSSHNSSGIPKAEKDSYFVFQPHDQQDPVHCLVMEKVEGMNLRDYLKKLGHPIDSQTAKRWLGELALILQEVHDRNILHRDIKPQNIILKPDGRLALIDFGAVSEGARTEGAATAKGGTEVASHVVGGTSTVSVGYTPHEQMNGHAMPQSDIYSLGKTFVFLLTGKEPLDIPCKPNDDLLEWREYAPNVETDLAKLIDQMISTSVRPRPASARDLLNLLNSNQPPITPPAPNPQPAPSPPPIQDIHPQPPSPHPLPTPQRKTPWFGILALVGVGIVGVGAFLISQNSGYQNSSITEDPSPSLPALSDYPKGTCGSGGTSYQVYVDDPSQKDFIRSNFCGDAWVTSFEGRQVVQVAQFGSEADAQSFVSFLEQSNIGSVFYKAIGATPPESDSQTDNPPEPPTQNSDLVSCREIWNDSACQSTDDLYDPNLFPVEDSTIEDNSEQIWWACYDQNGGYQGDFDADLTGFSVELSGVSTQISACEPINQ